MMLANQWPNPCPEPRYPAVMPTTTRLRSHRRISWRAWAAGLASVAGLAGLITSARAETSAVSATGFVITHRDEIKATPAEAWKAIVELPRWWNSAHTFSGQAANLSLDAQAGGCWCERWTDASGARHSAMHGTVALVQSGRVLRLFAALGPLQDLAVGAVLNIVTSAGTGPDAGKNFLRISYRVSGDASAALDKLAPAVDRVLAEQFKPPPWPGWSAPRRPSICRAIAARAAWRRRTRCRPSKWRCATASPRSSWTW